MNPAFLKLLGMAAPAWAAALGAGAGAMMWGDRPASQCNLNGCSSPTVTIFLNATHSFEEAMTIGGLYAGAVVSIWMIAKALLKSSDAPS